MLYILKINENIHYKRTQKSTKVRKKDLQVRRETFIINIAWSIVEHKNAVAEDSMVTGKFTHGIDVKGRLIVPAQLRRALGEICYLVMGADKCLYLYDETGWEAFCAKFAGKSLSESRKQRFIFANSASCEIDYQGRIVIPPELRAYAGIEREVTIIAMPDKAELWNSEEFRRSEEACFARQSMADIYEELGI